MKLTTAKARLLVVLLVVGMFVALLIPSVDHPILAVQQTIVLAPGDELTITCQTGLVGAIHGTEATIQCSLPVDPTPTSTPSGPAVTGFNGVQEGQVLNGKAEIEVLVTSDTITQVMFQLDGPRSDTHIEHHYPYFFKGDNQGVPNGWDTTEFPNGDYVLTAVVTDTTGQRGERSVHFSISNTAVLPTPTSTPTDSLSITIVGNHFVNQNGETVRLLGVNRSGTQYMCYDGDAFFDGPSDDASILAMKAWGITAVRVNLNEHCWLGLSDVPSEFGGEAYHAAIGDYINRLNDHGLYVIVDMHHSGPGLYSAEGMQPMADRDHAVSFWSSVATYFRNNNAVVFDLFNEPHPNYNQNPEASWTCIRDGGTCPGVGFVAEGMQQMLDAVRAVGATNPVLISGPQYAGLLDRWLEFKPHDPLDQLAASVHIYGQPLGSPYDDPATWDAHIAPVAQEVPVVIGEIGDTDCTHRFIDRLMPWADEYGISYLAWSWIVGSCAAEPSLITNYSGTPSQYGIGVRDHLLSLKTREIYLPNVVQRSPHPMLVQLRPDK